MTNAYKEYLRARELERAGIEAFRAIQPQRSTVESDVLVPLLQSLAIALAVGLAGGAVVLFVGFKTTGWARWALAGLTGRRIRQFLADCMIEGVKFGRDWLVDRGSLDRFLAERRK